METNDRIFQYKRFSVALSYPDAEMVAFFPEQAPYQQHLALEYDRLFRSAGIWLYGAEHMAQNEYQRVALLADIMGFYRAFGVEPRHERPDALRCELEFMHYLIFKEQRALIDGSLPEAEEKAAICLEAQKKFFAGHLYPAATKVAKAIVAQSREPFYCQIATELLAFLEEEAQLLNRTAGMENDRL